MSFSKTIHVHTARQYDVIIQRGILSVSGELIRKILPKAERCVIVSDSNVAPLYADNVKKSLETAGFQASVNIFPAGEAHKRLPALGGGATGDMCGFAAATYLRGIPFVQIPTTVLSQNDSSVGGKTGIDLECGKNLVGSFHQPCLVLADADTLSTLPSRYITDGFGEIIKHGCIKSAELFGLIEKHGTDMNRKAGFSPLSVLSLREQ